MSFSVSVNAPGGFNNITVDYLLNGVADPDLRFTESKTPGTTETSYTANPDGLILAENLVGQQVAIQITVVDDSNQTASVTLNITVESAALNAVVTTLLAAPLGDRTSETFYSVPLARAVTASEVVDGAAGTAMSADIDFGYYWLQSTGASLAAPSDYTIYDLTSTGQNWSTLNATTFRETTLDEAAFREQSTFADVETAYDNGTNEGQEMQGLAADQVLAFQTVERDGTQLKGLILIKSVTAGDGVNGQIDIEVLVQQ